MERELVRQSQSELREASNGPTPQPSTSTPDASTPTTPTPPRLTPNPMLLDSPAPTLTPTTSSPPPPLTPAPSLSSSHGPKAAAAAPPSPHLLVPAPPKLTSTATPALRTYSRPILPSPSSKTQTSSSSSSSPVGTTLPLPSSSSTSSSSAMHSNVTMTTKTPTTLTNGSTRPISTATSTPITPFHTPASPPGRQVSQAHPVGTPGLVRANQSPSPVRQRVSQQTLLLGKGLKGSGQDQVLLRAQMLILTSAMRPPPSSSSSSSSSSPPSSNPASAQLQSLTLRPPPPGALTIPPSLRLKPPSSAPPPLSRPHAALFPPLRPRPPPSTTATESPTTPSRHLSVPPPTLYSPVRAVPLRPRLHSPNGHRVASPRQSSALQSITAAPSSQAPPTSRPLAGLKTCPLSQSMLGSGQSQHSPLPATNPLSVASHFERSPSAARQLQIIALSSGRQTGTYAQTSVPPPAEPPDTSSQSKRTLSNDEALPLNPPLPKTSSPLPSPPTLLSPASPPSQATPQTQTPIPKGDAKEGEEQRDRGRAARQGPRDDAGKDLRPEKDDQRQKEKEEKVQKEGGDAARSRGGGGEEEEEEMEVTEEGTKEGKKMDQVEEEADGDAVMDQCCETSPELQQYQNPNPDPVKDPGTESKPNLGHIPVPVQTPVQVPVTAPVQVQVSVQVQVPVQDSAPQRLNELHPGTQEDFCENMSIQSDNQSALSSLSSQSPPSSPFITPPSENPAPLLAPPADHPTDLSLPQHEPEKVDKAESHGESQPPPEPEAVPEPLVQSDEESESFSQSLSGPWEPRAWPEGQQVLTHLVEGFVIQEGLQPFPVNRSSLLVPDQVTKPQEVNGTNGKAPPPVTDAAKQTEHSTDSDEEEGGDTDDAGARSAHRDRTVLHCQFCGKRGHAHNFMRSKRFCSTSCARGFNVRLTKRLRALSAGSRSERPRPPLNRAESVPGKPLLLRLPRDLWSAGRREKEGKEKEVAAEEEEEEEEEDMEGGGEEEDDDEAGEEDPAVAMTARMECRVAHRARRASAPAVTTSTPTTTFKPAPSLWSVEEVTAFIHTLPGCGDVAEAFRLQEIDGQALLLLTEDHLMTSMNIKLGPALKICAHINALKNQ